VQAIGMNQSNNLYPNIQKLILDRDGIFLLCSDGLSDFDRVEEYWEQEIMPIISGQLEIEDAVKNLLHLANTKNGHDNSTIALLQCQVRPRTTADTIPLDLQTLSQHITIDPLLPEADPTTSPFIDQSSLNFQTTRPDPSPNEPPEVGTKSSEHHHHTSPLENPFIILAIVLGVGAILWAILSLFGEKLWRQVDPLKDDPNPPIETVENSSSQAPEPISQPPQVYQVVDTKEITILDANSSGPEFISVNLPAGAIVELSGERDQITICNLQDKDKGIEQGNVFSLAEETMETIESGLTLLSEPTLDQLGICN
jgi:protein phosphatase